MKEILEILDDLNHRIGALASLNDNGAGYQAAKQCAKKIQECRDRLNQGVSTT